MSGSDYEFMELVDGIELKYVVVLVTTGGVEEAEKIATGLVDEEIVACVNIIAGVTSVFKWKGKVEKETECLLVIKTRSDRFPDVVRTVKSLHGYDVPEIIGLPIVEGNTSYLKWIDEVT